MAEELKIDEETKQALGDASLKRIGIISHMVKEYFRALNGTLNSTEFMSIGMDCVQAGLQLISRSNDMDNLNVDQRIATMSGIKALIDSIFDKVYTNPEVVANMVAKAAVESASRDPKLKSFKQKKED